MTRSQRYAIRTGNCDLFMIVGEQFSRAVAYAPHTSAMNLCRVSQIGARVVISAMCSLPGPASRVNRNSDYGRMRRRLVIGIVLVALRGVIPAAAETVPLSRAAPQPKEGAARPSQPRPAASAQPQNPSSDLVSGLRSLFNLDKQPEAPHPPTITSFTPAQRAQAR
jgi:hypothetical protein